MWLNKLLLNLRGTEKPVRWAGSPTCSRSVSPWEKQLAQRREKRRDFTSHLERASTRLRK